MTTAEQKTWYGRWWDPEERREGRYIGSEGKRGSEGGQLRHSYRTYVRAATMPIVSGNEMEKTSVIDLDPVGSEIICRIRIGSY